MQRPVNQPSKERLAIEARIKEYELEGKFDVDTNIDPPTVPLKPHQVDYENRKLSSRINSRIANFLAFHYFERLIHKGILVYDGASGLENMDLVKGGAIITANHFNPYDNYALYHAIRKKLGGRDLYKVIREGNYTSFPGIYGYFFRHCNTLPIPSDFKVMKEFLHGVDALLKRGEKVLIYPEQAMWLNYRKPRPFKSGAFRFAVQSDAPVIPCFISTRDIEKLDSDGRPLLAYFIHVMEPIYPDKSLKEHERIENLRKRNYQAIKAKYEEVYGEELTYSYPGEIR